MKVYKEFDLSNFNSYNIKSICKKAFFPDTELDIIDFFKENCSSTVIIIGNGNNLILSKKYYEESFLILNSCFEKMELESNVIEAEAGATMENVSLFAMKNKLEGLEPFYDIPSSVGGAVFMNAGTGKIEIKNLLLKIRYLNLDTFIVSELNVDQLELGYRESVLQKKENMFILKAWFTLGHGCIDDINNKMQKIKTRRWAKQPREYPNCGSVFKRPKGFFVGELLDNLGLKGYTIGGAQVSKKHSGFIINVDKATGEDVLKLIKYIQKKVFFKFKVNLQIEQRVI